MTEHDIDRIQSAIDHIKTSLDVDPWAAEIAVEAMQEKMEHLRDGTKKMNDTVWRLDAVEAVREELKRIPTSAIRAMNVIEQLPSAQHGRTQGMIDSQGGGSPTVKLETNLQPTCNQLATDTISRQDAIEIVDFECGEWKGLAQTIVNGIKKLPSAQHEKVVSRNES